jgi:signal transduction histidine kinase/CheY-like chemotaxis protein
MKGWTNRLPIRWRLILVTVVTSVVAQLIAGTIMTVYDNQIYKTQKTREDTVEAEILAASLASSLVFDDVKATQDYLDSLKANPEIKAAGAYREDRTLAASFSRAEAPPRLLPATAPLPGQHFEGDDLLVSVPVTQGDAVVGFVYLAIGTEQLVERLVRYGGIVLLAIGASLAVTVPISVRLNAAISNPLHEIASAAARIAAGDLSVTVTPVSRGDEIGVLVTTFGQMVASLRQRTADLVRAVGELRAEIDAHKRTGEQLVHAQKMEAIGNLTGGMAHDFNNLLGVIIGNLDELSDQMRNDPKVNELAGEALDAALRGADLTRSLLAFARRQPLRPERIDVNERVAGITKLLSRTLGEAIEVKLDLAPDARPVVADPAQLEASLINLATNARDAMPQGGRLVIATRSKHLDADYAAQHDDVAPGDYTMIEVSDNGIGIAPETLTHIFEPFYTTKEQGKGTGLGLSMVFGYVKQSGGHINVYSEEGVGTTFRLYLPHAVDGAVVKDAAVAEQTDAGRGETILAVEDNASLRRVVVRQLRDLNYRVLEAEDAAAALRILEQERVDLLFTDVIMPGANSGLDIARITMERWPHIRVVLTSGFHQAKLEEDLKSFAGVRLLSKPYRKADLARTVRETLSS